MIKQILGKIPRKPSKSLHSDSNGDGGLVNSGSDSSLNSSYGSSNGTLKSNSASSKSSNSGLGGLYSGNGSSAPPSTNSSKTNQVWKSAPVIGSEVGLIMAHGNGVYEALPGFRDVSSSEKPNLFIRKLNMCCVVFDFNDPTKHLKEKDIKRQTLLELVDYISSVNSKFNEATMQEITKMVAAIYFELYLVRMMVRLQKHMILRKMSLRWNRHGVICRLCMKFSIGLWLHQRRMQNLLNDTLIIHLY